MKNKLLILLKNTQVYLSGQEIGEKLGVSRAAVWKAIESLRKEGYVIEAVTNKGYKLIESGDLLNAADVQAGLNTTFVGREMIVIDSVDSTNNYLRQKALEGVAEGAVAIAHEQTLGKGRRGKAWMSQKGHGLWMSVLVKPPIQPNEASKLTLVAGLSVCQALRNLGYDASIKWPNDIIIKNKKVCGILAEMTAQVEAIEFVVIGIGINTNVKSFPQELENIAISLKIISGADVKRSEVAAEVLNEFEKNYNLYIKNGFLSLKEEYETNCITLNQEVQIIGKNGFEGFATAISDEGELVVRKADGRKEIVYSSEVSVRGVM